MKVVITGAGGFLGWHLRCRLRALGTHRVEAVDRAAFADLASVLPGADAVIHVAGVNRARDDREVTDGNVNLARALRDAVRASGARPRIAYANSTQRGNGTPYGDSKATASQILADVAREIGSPYVDAVLPNLFGEHGRPHYNSFVATFCRLVLDGEGPAVIDRDVELLHVQDAAAALADGLDGAGRVERPSGEVTSVSAVLEMLEELDAVYSGGDVPRLDSRFRTQLFNTYRAAAFERRAAIPLVQHSDARGALVETSRVHGGGGQSFVSTTAPSARRGEHFHLEKVERFVVVKGRARIRLRRLFTDDVVELVVDGANPVAVDMPTMWAHDLTNIGDEELMTYFWTNTLFDPADPDTFAEPVNSDRVRPTEAVGGGAR